MCAHHHQPPATRHALIIVVTLIIVVVTVVVICSTDPLHSAAQSGKAKHVEILLNAHRGKKGKSTQPKAVDPNTLNKYPSISLLLFLYLRFI